MTMDFGKKLKMLIEEKKTNVSELAQKTGINRNTLYSYIRRGTQKVDPIIIRKLADALGVDVYYFIGTQPPEVVQAEAKNEEELAHTDELDLDNLTEEDIEFITVFSQLTPENRKLLLANGIVYLRAQGNLGDHQN